MLNLGFLCSSVLTTSFIQTSWIKTSEGKHLGFFFKKTLKFNSKLDLDVFGNITKKKKTHKLNNAQNLKAGQQTSYKVF